MGYRGYNEYNILGGMYMIVGHGIDAQIISQVSAVAERRPGFVDVILTPAERAVYDARKGKHRQEFLAGRFSIKEAYSKAIGTGIGSQAHWQDIEILPNDSGQPIMVKHPKQDKVNVHISISHTGDTVHSSVILEEMSASSTKISNQQDIASQAIISTRRPAWIEISENAIQKNIAVIRELTGAHHFIAIVKANAYGHGMAQVLTAAKHANVDGFGVATIDEGIWLRQYGILEPIFILGVTPVTYVDDLVKYQLIPVVTSEAWLNAAVNKLSSQASLVISIGVDTGMGRIGIRHHDELQRVVEKINQTDQLILKGIGMHFATADEKDEAYYQKQVHTWHELVDDLPLPQHIWYHLANSATALWHEQPSRDAIRVGAAMYGFNPSGKEMLASQLTPALTLKAELVHVKQAEAGASISYGATYQTKQPEWIGTLPLGYADGYARQLQGMYGLLPDGRHVEIIGRIAMDQLMVRLPEEMPIGTVITLIGKAGDEEITLVDLAERLNTIPYEIATSLSTRLPRKLVK